jgi:DNA sulfur modification protein DndB
MNKMGKIILPTLKAKMGDWIYYVTLLPFSEVAKRVSLADEIHKDKGLSKMIQRKVTNRTKDIVTYLKTQDQRFFNSLILGIYGGNPHWQEILIDKKSNNLNEEELNYLNRTFGILTLTGEEKIFAIDGQHRSKAIKDATKEKEALKGEEIAVIFVAHKKTQEGEIRTRRLFSTLNRYAKPVNISEIIALDEEDNCAIITRNIVEEYDKLKHRILFNQNRSISTSNTSAFTNIIMLYDLVKIILMQGSVFGIKVDGEDKLFTKRRQTVEIIQEKQEYFESLLSELFEKIPALKKFIENGEVDRRLKRTSLLFRPIGQTVLFSVLKVGIDNGFEDEVIEFFATQKFSTKNNIWKKIFIDSETGRIKTDKSAQKYAFQLILLKLGYNVKLSKKDREIHDNFDIDPNEL